MRKVVVVGAGKTGISTANFLSKKGYRVILNELKAMENVEGLDKSVEFVCGGHPEDIFKGAEFVVLSPGIAKKDFPVKCKRIVGDIEVFYWFNKSKIVAITGTNGKSTTTSLIGEILKTKFKVFVGGNIGIPAVEGLYDDYDFSVLELSSFQLELIDEFKPDIAVFLNISVDHLDRYSSFYEYKSAKMRIFKNFTGKEIAVVNRDFDVLEKEAKGKKIFFSLKEEVKEGAFLKDDRLFFRVADKSFSVSRDELSLKGEHFCEDFMAAGIVALICGVEPEIVLEVFRNFKGLPHRMEFVAEIDGIKFYNDSKSTTVASTLKAIESFKSNKVILLMGGIHKGERYTEIKKFRNLKKVFCYGEARDIIFEDLKGTNVSKVKSFYEAVPEAIREAERGDVVLLSPACSSFDEFKNFEERGEKFRCMIMQLQKQRKAQ